MRSTIRELFDRFDHAGSALCRAEHWFDENDLAMAADACTGEAWASEPRLLSARFHAIFPGEFNAGLDRGLNKADIEREALQQLVAAALAEVDAEQVVVWIDRLD